MRGVPALLWVHRPLRWLQGDVKLAQLKRANPDVSEEEVAVLRQRVKEKAERETSAYFATSRMWDDGILMPTDTRNALAIALSVAANAPLANPSYGVFRM